MEEEFDIEVAYEEAPQEVKDLLDEFEDKESYEELAVLRYRLKELNYDMDYYLDGSITMLKPSKI